MSSYVLNTYARTVKKNFVRGKGVYLYTDKEDRYLDFCSGISCTNLGYQHEHLIKTMKEMVDKPWHLSNLFSKLGVKRRNQATSKARELGLL